eukprot:3659132-Alexandrium_andersonii.AAC.1
MSMKLAECKSHGGAGRPSKCPALRHALFEWFAETRRRVRTRLPPDALKDQAKFIARHLEANGVDAQDVPRITRSWLLRFRKEYCISLRAPNRVSKVPRAILEERLRI